MPSAPPTRYQSRLFNVLNRHSRRLIDQCDRTVRHLKVAATWGAQILLYPMYLLVQGSLSVGRQLSSVTRVGLPRLKAFTKPDQEAPPAADTPIQRVLSEVKTLGFPEQPGSVTFLLGSLPVCGQSAVDTTASATQLTPDEGQPIATSAQAVVQGVASLITTRTLVLVTVQNQVLDILTPQQQQKLAARISWEVADLLHQWRLRQTSKTKPVARRLSPVPESHLALPMKLFWQVMAWVQTSPVAAAVNLFGESALIADSAPSPGPVLLPPRQQLSGLHNPLLSLQPVPQTLAFLDRTVAELESHQLVPGSEVVVVLCERTTHSLRDRTRNLFGQIPGRWLTSRGQVVSEASQPHRARIQALIHAAVAYFFGKRSFASAPPCQDQQPVFPHQGVAQQLSGRHSPALAPAPGTRSPNLDLDPDLSDPWLTWGDLFGNEGTETTLDSQSQRADSQVLLPETFTPRTPIAAEHSPWGALKHYLNAKRPSELPTSFGAGRHKRERSPSVIQPTRPTAPASGVADGRRPSLSPEATTATITPPCAPSADLMPAPEWIETQAIPVGYVKHPLEQLLELLDVVMLWLEERLFKLWRWLRQLTIKN